MMSKTVLVALNLPKSYMCTPFTEQLQFLKTHIETVIALLKKEHNDADEWVIAAREYGITDLPNNFQIDRDQKALFKTAMASLSKTDPEIASKLSIIGTTATKRLISQSDKEIVTRKLNKIAQAYKVNAQFNGDEQFRMHQEQSLLLAKQDFYQIRNTAYVFSNGECIQRHDKITPFNESKLISNGIFKPGVDDSQSNVIHGKIGLEICMEHDQGVLAKTTPKASPPPIQLVVSANVRLKPEHCISPYVCQIDGVQPICLVTEQKPNECDVSLYSYDFDKPVLTPKAPQTMHDYVFSRLSTLIEQDTAFNIEKLLYDNHNKEILQRDDYVKLLKLSAEKYNCKDNTSRAAIRPILAFVLLKLASLGYPLDSHYRELFIANLCGDIAENDPTALPLVLDYRPLLEHTVLEEELLNYIFDQDRAELFDLFYGDRLDEIGAQRFDSSADTLLHLVVKFDAPKITKLLLQHDSNLMLKDAEGNTVLALAKKDSLAKSARCILKYNRLSSDDSSHNASFRPRG